MFDAIAYHDEGRSVTYKEMLENADRIGKRVEPRSLVLFVATNTGESLEGYLGFLRNRAVVMMAASSIDADSLEALLEAYKPEYVWCPDSFGYSSDSEESYGRYRLCETGMTGEAKPHSDLALMLTTSGSTGSRKYVRLTYENIRANALSIVDYLGISPGDCAITTLPFSYSYGLSIINSHLLAGASLVLTEKTMFDREFWDLVRARSVTTFGGVPYTYSMLKRLRFERMDLPSLRYITQAGGRLGRDLHEHFARLCAEKNIDFIAMYGQTEATARIAYVPASRSVEKAGSVGIAIPGGELSIRDESGGEVEAPDTAGELVYRGPNVSMGYASGRIDVSRGDDFGGVLATGDLACRDEDGFYRIVGRMKRFLKIYGNRVNLDELESMLAVEGIVAACSGEDDALRVFVEDGDPKSIRSIVSEKTGLYKGAFDVRLIDALPRNDAGKIQYSSLEDPC